MSLAALITTVASAEQIAAQEKENRISACFPALPTWTDEDKMKWMDAVVLKLKDEASKRQTTMTCLLGAGASLYHHAWETKESPKAPHGLWRTRDQSHGVDVLYLASPNGWLLEFELPECVPGMFFFMQDTRIKMFDTLRYNAKEHAEAETRLQEISRQVQRQFTSFWISHSDIPISECVTKNSKGLDCCAFCFDWAGAWESTAGDEPYEVKRAREDVVKYQKKLDLAVEQLQSARKRTKITK